MIVRPCDGPHSGPSTGRLLSRLGESGKMELMACRPTEGVPALRWVETIVRSGPIVQPACAFSTAGMRNGIDGSGSFGLG